jgi:hypothetical protein
VLARKLRGIAIIAGLIALAIVFLAVMPGRLVMRSTLHWTTPDTYEFSIVSAGGLTGALHGAAIAVLAFRLWRRPTVERAWVFIGLVPMLALVTRFIDYLVWSSYRTSLTLTGQVYSWLDLVEVAIAIVVLPLALWLARRTGDVPQARVLPS